MRNVGLASSPDASADPRERGQDHIEDRAESEHLHGTVAGVKPYKINGEQAIGDGEDGPADKTGSQEVAGHAHKSENGYGCEKTERGSGDEVALESNAFKNRNAVGDEHPDGEHQGKSDAGIYTGASGRVSQNVEPAITWKMSANSDHERAPNASPE